MQECTYKTQYAGLENFTSRRSASQDCSYYSEYDGKEIPKRDNVRRTTQQ